MREAYLRAVERLIAWTLDHVWLIAGIFFIVVIIASQLDSQLAKKRREALTQLAMQLGLHYDWEGEPLDERAKAAIQLFNLGDSKHSRDIFRGTVAGTDVVIFDYSYDSGGSEDSTTHEQTVAAYRFDPGAPAFVLAPENFLHIQHKLASMFGHQPIDFDTNKDFSDRYVVLGRTRTPSARSSTRGCSSTSSRSTATTSGMSRRAADGSSSTSRRRLSASGRRCAPSWTRRARCTRRSSRPCPAAPSAALMRLPAPAKQPASAGFAAI